MSLINDRDRKQLEKMFEELEHDVNIIMFTQEHECEYCKTTRELLEELSGISPKIHLEVKDFVTDKEEAEKYGVDKIPATIIMGDRDYGIRFFGIPSGYEFSSLIDDILDVSHRDPKLPPDVLEKLAKIDRPVHMQVMVTPTCPYCPMAVRAAHRFAMANENIRGDMVEVSEYPHIAIKYGVQGVPNTIVNEDHSLVGAMPEARVADSLLEFLAESN